MGPIAAARVGYINDEYVLNPVHRPPIRTPSLELVVAGTRDAVMMVESEAKELSEDVMLGAVMFGHQADLQTCHRRHHPPGGKGREGPARRAAGHAWRHARENEGAATTAELSAAFQKPIKFDPS